MDISPRLLQPLAINTNIVYDLDLSRFPGIEGPEHVHQPALCIATPESLQFWQQALEHQWNHDESETEVDLEATDDLFQLIESLAEVGSTEDSGYVQDLFDDVIDSTSSTPDHVTDSWNLSLGDVEDDLLLLNFLSDQVPRYDSLVTPDLAVTRDMESALEEEYAMLGRSSDMVQEKQMVQRSALKKRKRDADLDGNLAIKFIGEYSCELEEYNRFG